MKMSKRTILLTINCLLLLIGYCGGGMIMRLYFIHGGGLIWFSSWLETAAWPIIVVPLVFQYVIRRHSEGGNASLVIMNRRVFIGSTIIGILTGIDDYLYAYGVAKLPISTMTLVLATHLGFVAIFAFLVVKQKFTAYSINAVVLLMTAAGVLAINTNGDRPIGESNGVYMLGFFMTLGAGMLYALVLPLVELMYKKANQTITYTLVLEVQLVMCFFATVVCTVGLIIDHGFQKIAREALEYTLGRPMYYIVVVLSAIMWQCFFLGVIGVINYSSSLLSGIITALAVPTNEVLGVICYGEKFTSSKGLSLGLALWGLSSYFYGEYKKGKKEKEKEALGEEVSCEEEATNSRPLV